MAKICDVVGCEYPVFGTDRNNRKRYCKRHQHLRTDIVRSLRKNTAKQRMEKLARNKHDFNIFKFGFHSESEMFEYIWWTRPHISQISKRPLQRTYSFFSMFAHVLDKKNYPLYRLNPNNIFLILPREHVLVDAGTFEDREKYSKEFPSANFDLFFSKRIFLQGEYAKLEKKFKLVKS